MKILDTIVKHAKKEEDDPLTPLVEEYYLKRNLPKYVALRLKTFEIPVLDRPRPPGRISPSQAGGCARQATFSYTGFKGTRRTNPEQEAIFEDGKWRHHKWDYIFVEMAAMFPNRFKVISIEESVTIEGFRIAGSLDAIVKIKCKGKWRTYVVDFKGANSYAFEDAWRTQAPNPRYVAQILAYMKSKGKKRGLLLFESKDKNRWICYPVKMSEALWADVRLWAREVLAALEAEKLPPKDPECQGGTFLYNRCPFAKACFGKLTDRQLNRAVFVGFPGVDALWKEGNRIVKEYETNQTG